MKYLYLADGTKLEASSGDGNSTRYRGSFILHSDSSGAESLETIVLPEGIARTVGDSLKLYTFVRDHLGSVRAVVDLEDSLVCEENGYYSYGGKFPSGEGNQVFDNRWGYSKQVAETYFKDGLWTISSNDDGTYSINKTKITKEQYLRVIEVILKKNEHGLNK